jgi:uncharacterized protein
MEGRRLELLLLFGVGPAVLAIGPRWAVSVAILASGLVCAILLLRDPRFPRGALWGQASGREVARVFVRTLLACLGVLAVTALASRRQLFPLPRQHPGRWGLIMVLYPLSAYAQEIAYRTFFFHRYGALFARAWTRVVVNAAFFGWGHITVNNLRAVALATVVGGLFAATYERTRATWLVSLEHALYGDFVFSVGLGPLFYSSARWFGG